MTMAPTPVRESNTPFTVTRQGSARRAGNAFHEAQKGGAKGRASTKRERGRLYVPDTSSCFVLALSLSLFSFFLFFFRFWPQKGSSSLRGGVRTGFHYSSVDSVEAPQILPGTVSLPVCSFVCVRVFCRVRHLIPSAAHARSRRAQRERATWVGVLHLLEGSPYCFSSQAVSSWPRSPCCKCVNFELLLRPPLGLRGLGVFVFSLTCFLFWKGVFLGVENSAFCVPPMTSNEHGLLIQCVFNG